MRGKLAAAVVAVGLFATAGCGGDGDDGRSTAEICEDINQVVEPMVEDFNSVMTELGAAAAREDEAALAAAAEQFNALVEQITSTVREGAADASDAEFSQALEDFATALEDLQQQTIGAQPDLATFGGASERVSEFCNPAQPGPNEQ